MKFSKIYETAGQVLNILLSAIGAAVKIIVFEDGIEVVGHIENFCGGCEAAVRKVCRAFRMFDKIRLVQSGGEWYVNARLCKL